MTFDPEQITDPILRAQFEANQANATPAEIRTLDQYLEWEIDVPASLVSPNALVRGGLTATIGAGGVGKTSLLLGRLMRWAAGLPWLPGVPEAFVPTQPLKTLIIENEGSGGLFQQKIRTMRENSGFDADADILVGQNILIWGEGGYSDVRLDEPATVQKVRAALEEWKPDVLFLEPFARLWRGDENSNTEMNAILSGLENLAAKHGIAVMLAHHRRKGKVEAGQSAQDFARGASALEGAVTFMEFLGRSKNGWLEVDATKNRYGDDVGPYYLDWKGNESGWHEHVDAVGVLLDLIREKDGETTFKALARAGTGLGEDEHRVQAMLEQGARQHRVRPVEVGGKEIWVPWDNTDDGGSAAAGQRF